jgi:hypothetical protein
MRAPDVEVVVGEKLVAVMLFHVDGGAFVEEKLAQKFFSCLSLLRNCQNVLHFSCIHFQSQTFHAQTS